MLDIASGRILVADPFLKDPNFMRTVVFLCEHEEAAGSFGFVINRPYNQVVGNLISGLDGCSFPVYFGGPVQMDTIHFLHQRPDLVGGVEVVDNIYWGGDFDALSEAILNNNIREEELRFYLGYSGWSAGQLKSELDEKSWLTTEGNRALVFHQDYNRIWQDALLQMGGKYEQLVHYPIDPQLN
jgi:putative transcriptional regulator